jgi:hypothetical protein
MDELMELRKQVLELVGLMKILTIQLGKRYDCVPERRDVPLPEVSRSTSCKGCLMIQVDAQELRTIALRHYNRIPTARGDDLKSFLQLVLTWLCEWIVDKKFRRNVQPGYCAFVLAPEIVAGELPEGAEKTFQFKEDTTPNLGGNVYLTDYALNNVLRYSAGCQDLNDIIKSLMAKKLSHLPFIAFDVDAQLVYVYDDVKTLSWKFPLRAEIQQPFKLEERVDKLEPVKELPEIGGLSCVAH